MVVGLQSDDFGTIVSALHIVVKKDGAVVYDETMPSTTKTATGAITGTTKELPISGAPGAKIEVVAEAMPAAGGAPIVTRLAAARLVAGGKKLLRVYLEARCVQLPPIGNQPGAGVSCAAPLTCISGICQSGDVGDDAIEDYEPTWSVAPPDICRPAKHGPPEVMIGTGQTDYATLNEGQTLQLERGPQGGHHVWIAARMKNLRQSGSTTTITSSIEGDPEPVPPVSFVFTFDRDEGSYCKVWGLRYQVDAGAGDLRTAYKRFLGKRLKVTVEIADSTGAKAQSTHTIQIADKLLCPDGTTDTCNTP